MDPITRLQEVEVNLDFQYELLLMEYAIRNSQKWLGVAKKPSIIAVVQSPVEQRIVPAPVLVMHWENVYREIIGIYRNFDGKLLNSYCYSSNRANSSNSTVFVAIYIKSKTVNQQEMLISLRYTVTA